ncbi:hypothetical protein BTVI_37411 [Pitangus sulphuratus]|nr:hypothetical protein BTVI_37411 [Pitangus sulphuratus]
MAWHIGSTEISSFSRHWCTVYLDATWRKNQKWKAAVWSPTQQVAEATEGESELIQFAELKAIQLALDIAE